MAAGNFTLYNDGKLNVLNGVIDLDADTIVAVLLANAYTPAATHDTYSDISGNVISDGDYSPQVLASKTVTQASGTVTFDAADVSYGSNVNITARYIALVKRNGGSLAGTDELIGYMDLETTGEVSSTNGSFDVAWNASGIFTAS